MNKLKAVIVEREATYIEKWKRIFGYQNFSNKYFALFILIRFDNIYSDAIICLYFWN